VHELWRRDYDLSDLALAEPVLALLVVDDPDLDIGERHADRPDLLFAAHWIRDDRHLGLGQRIALDDHAACHLFPTALRLGH
jgi:hypothetical protein